MNMKGSSMNTHMGNIVINNEVIAQYAGSVAVECFGIVGMAGINVKDGLVRLLKMDSMTRGINVSVKNNKLTLDFHVIVAYGVSISAVADNLISASSLPLQKMPSQNNFLHSSIPVLVHPRR